MCSSLSAVLASMLAHFRNKPFMWHQAPGILQYALVHAYNKEEASLKETVAMMPLGDVPHTANVIVSQVIYKVKVADDNVLSRKVLIWRRGNDESI